MFATQVLRGALTEEHVAHSMGRVYFCTRNIVQIVPKGRFIPVNMDKCQDLMGGCSSTLHRFCLSLFLFSA